jgi:hypothetical protein
MSSATLTRGKQQPAVPATPVGDPDAVAARPVWSSAGAFFALAALVAAAVAIVILRDTPGPALFFVVFTLAAAALCGVALYRTLAPLAEQPDEATVLIAGRTRASLERDKMLTLRSIKELEFDRAMGKVSEGDFVEMRDRLRDRAMRLLRQLEGGGMYRRLIERELASRLAEAPDAVEHLEVIAPGTCLECGTVNDPDARFCKMCGQAMSEGRS